MGPTTDLNGAVRRDPVRETLWPLAASLALHAGVLVVAALAARAVNVVLRGAESQAVAAQTELTSNQLPAPVSLHGLRGPGDDALLKSAQDRDPTAGEEATGWAAVRGADWNGLAEDVATDEEAGASIIGIGADAAFARGGDRLRENPGGRAGPVAPFGAPVIRGTPGGGIFAHPDARAARSVVYVCDASGSMINHFDSLRHQIERSIHRLKAVQSFNILFFREEGATGLEGGRLVLATGANKGRATAFLSEVTASGTTEPLPALGLALRQKPDLVWLLTDGDFPDNDAVLDFIRTHNPNGRVQINTIAFVQRGEGYERVLRTIARENRGEFRYVDEKELR